MDKYKLIYFNTHGRCEHIRYLFAVGKVPYDDHRVLLKDWSQLKPTTPLGFLPVLEINGKQTLGESIAIGRYVAKVGKLYGSNIYEEGLIDMVVDSAASLLESFIPVYFYHDESNLGEKVKKCKTTCDNLSKILDGNDYFVGNKISWADIHFYHCLEVVTHIGRTGYPEVERMLENTPNLEKLYNRVDQHPEILKMKKENENPYVGGILFPRPEKPVIYEKAFKAMVELEESMGLK